MGCALLPSGRRWRAVRVAGWCSWSVQRYGWCGACGCVCIMCLRFTHHSCWWCACVGLVWQGDKLRVAVVLDTAAPEITACTAAVNSFYTGHADGTVHKWGLKSASTSGGSAGNLFETNFAGSGSQDARGAVGGGLQCMPRGVLHTGHRSSSSSAGGRHRGGGGAASASSSSGGTSRQHRVRPVGFLWWCGRHRVLLASTGGRICVFNIRGRPLASIGNAETAASTVSGAVLFRLFRYCAVQ